MTERSEQPQGSSGPEAVAGAADDAYWRKSFGNRAYTRAELGYEYYRPAYRAGWDARARHGGRPFEAVQGELQDRWDPETTGLKWEEALPAIRDAYERDVATDMSDPGNPLA